MIEDLKKINDVSVVLANQAGVIIYVNKKFEEIFKWTTKEIVGKPITVIIPPDLHDAHNLGFSRFIATEKSQILNQKLKLNAITKDGEIFTAEHFIQAERVDDTWIFGATIKAIV